MIKVVLEPSAKLRAEAASDKYTTTFEDLPKGIVELADYPRIGDSVGNNITGENWIVEQVHWGFNLDSPLVFLSNG